MSLDSSKLAALRAKISASTASTAPSISPSQKIEDEKTNQTPSNHSVCSSNDSSNIPSQDSDGINRILDQTLPSNSSSMAQVKGGEGNQVHKANVIGGNEISFAQLEFKSKLSELEGMLLVPHPRMPVLLREIHTQLAKDPEIVTLMTEDEIGIIVNGLKKQTATELSGTVAKQSKAKDKKVPITLDML